MKVLLFNCLIFVTLCIPYNNLKITYTLNPNNTNSEKSGSDTVPFNWNSANNFKTNQLIYERVKNAYDEKQTTIEKLLKTAHCYNNRFELKLRAFKTKKILEVFIRPEGKGNFKKLIEYEICFIPGKLGPKKSEGDMQVPEGIYHIDRFNPASKFHLSLGINYPNSKDLKRSSEKPGGDIFIHGNCISVGCLPMTDEKMKEIYILAIESKDQLNSMITVEIFPFKMNDNNFIKNHSIYEKNKSLYDELLLRFNSI